jgi:rhodanese-related sulfurtransferase
LTSVKVLSIKQLLQMQKDNDKFTLAYVLPGSYFKRGHIPDSINLSVDDIEKKAKSVLKKGDKIVVYCESYSCHASTRAAEMLLKMGYKNVYDFKAGKQGWVDSGLKLAK